MHFCARLIERTAVELHPIALENFITLVGCKFPSEVMAKDSIVIVGSRRFVFTEGKE